MKGIALGAVAFTIGSGMAKAAKQADTIWVYEGSSEATFTPDCQGPSDDVCARLHEYDPVNQTVGAEIPGAENVLHGERP